MNIMNGYRVHCSLRVVSKNQYQYHDRVSPNIQKVQDTIDTGILVGFRCSFLVFTGDRTVTVYTLTTSYLIRNLGCPLLRVFPPNGDPPHGDDTLPGEYSAWIS